MAVPGLFLACLLVFAPPAAAGDYVNEDFGFRVALPDGWTASEVSASDSSLQLALAPTDAADRVQLLVRVNPPGVGADPEAARQLTMRTAENDPNLKQLVEQTRQVAGRQAPAVRVDSHAPDKTWRVRQAFLAEHDFLFLLQDVTLVEEFDQRVDSFDEVWSKFEFIPVSEEQSARVAMVRLAERCGSEIDWAADWDEAVARAREDKRPILVSARMYPGFDISDDRMSGTFMDPDIVALVQERYVPMRIGLGADVPFADESVYGMSSFTFGSAALIVSPDGQVLLDALGALDELLIEGLALDPTLPGPPAGRADSALDQARIHYRRGELDQVTELLAQPTGVQEHRLLADLHRRLRDGPAALEALGRARAADEDGAAGVDLDLDEARVLMRLGRSEAAVELVQRVLDGAPEHARVPEALFMRGSLARVMEDRGRAEAWLQRVIDEHRQSRWAWKAAAMLTSTGWSLDEGGTLAWPDEELYALLRPPVFAALPLDQAQQARQDALEFLLAAQREDGGWNLPSDFGNLPDDPPDHFQLATSAICVQALLPHREDPRVQQAIDRAVDWVLSGYEQAVTEGEPVYFLDYTVWSRPYLLWLLADLAELGVRERRVLEPIARQLCDELAQLQKPGGGWSYYVTGDIDSAPPTTLMAMSFTTAINVIALIRAREAGLAPPEELIERGLDGLEEARNDEGIFAYMTGPNASRPTGTAGAAGRGPLCAWALQRGKRAGPDEVAGALDAFMQHSDSYSRETGKALMHTGLQAQGSHWLMFDYAYAAVAAAALPDGQGRRFAKPLLQLILGTRTADGAYVDNPIVGAALGAGMALLAYEHLLPDAP